MTYPLIQQPSPLQQLADLLAQVRQRQMQEREQSEELRRRSLYLTLAQREQALSERRAGEAEKRWNVEQARQERQDAIENARQQLRDLVAQRTEAREQRRDLVAAAQQRRTEARQRAENIMDPFIRQGVAFDPSVYDQIVAGSAPTVGRRLAGTPEPGVKQRAQQAAPPIGEIAAEAMRRGQRGINPRAGTFKGATFMPEPYGVSVSLGGANQRRVTTQDRLMQAAIGGALQQMRLMEDIEDRNPLAAVDPDISAIIERGGHVPWIGGVVQAVAGPTAQRYRGSDRQMYQAMLGEFIHTYASSLPGRRLGPELLTVLKPNFSPPPGTTDLAVIRSFRTRRREAATRMAQAAAGMPVDLEGLLSPEIRAQLDRVSPLTTGVEPPETVPDDEEPTVQPAAPIVLPRYRRRTP